ncbi:MAG: FHA domain-containing protein [Polyangiaceae bacterium]|nr:FHA domain-containing protein [Polyangiaceae bacterium]
MAYRLRYKSQEITLTPGHFLIGRSDECQLTLDDGLVSRVHARVSEEADGLFIEDLGSRNGVTVNGEPLSSKLSLHHGDRIQIGEQEITVLRKTDAQAKTMQQRSVGVEESLAVLSSVAEKALALGRGQEAERLLENYLGGILISAESGQLPEPEVVARASSYAIQLASLTNKAKWVHFIFRLHTVVARPCSAEVVDKLYEVIRRISNVGPESLRSYLGVLDRQQNSMSKSDRFLFKRLQGLEPLTSLK